MTIKELLALFGNYSRSIGGWFNNSDAKIGRISGDLKDKIQETQLPFGNNHYNSDDSNKINQHQTEETQLIETSANSRMQKVGNNGYSNSNGINGYSHNYYNSYRNQRLLEKIDIAPLNIKEELQGSISKYVIDELIKDNQSIDKYVYYEYRGKNLDDKQLVKIKEYIFVDRELQQYQQEFVKRTNLKFKSNPTNGQDFRLIISSDAFVDKNKNRCYIITLLDENYISLRDYLNIEGNIDEIKVSSLLQQVLQSLDALHSQKIMLGNNDIFRGLAHGNINIDSLLIKNNNDNFLVYLSDFAIWEDILKNQEFRIASYYCTDSKFKDDLRSLGDVALRALFWNQVRDNDFNLNNSNIIQDYLSKRNDGGLTEFIFRLIGANGIDGKFQNIEEALKAFKRIKPNKSNFNTQHKLKEINSSKQTQISVKQQESNYNNSVNNSSFFSKILLFIPIFALCLIAWFLFDNREEFIKLFLGDDKVSEPETSVNDELLSDSQVIVDEQVSDWINKKSFASYKEYFSLKNILSNKSKGKIIFDEREIRKTEEVIQQIAKKKTNFNFAIVSLAISNKSTHKSNNSDEKECKFDEVPKNLQCQVIAYGGIVFFVPYSDGYKNNSILNSLNGNIDDKKLADYYQDKGEKKAIKLYKSEDNKLVDLVTKQFNKEQFVIPSYVESIEKSKFNKTLQDIRKNFENDEVDSIGFGLLSKVYGQCSVYPLALKDVNDEKYVQPFVDNNGDEISPTIDLCNDKGSYRLNYKAFRNDSDSEKYPLRFAIAVIYPTEQEEGKLFADMMLTDEGQTLLEEVGLVPAKGNQPN
ncbi:putative serine/threonine kinase [Calothrix parasitica NIES-267]|uniref:Putative serine/threonine kinase n=1 Tax=Calothrix parasitica NIES-267 TaxID=1973488 RepID=A0A1Z4LJV1_9CYAN|nr:putative serine/threonine kinase [Calothrix parasitica NIES-267]